MTKNEYGDEQCERTRDQRGRFIKGASGNRNGRPRKQPEQPKSLARCFAERLAKEIAVNDNGVPQQLSYRELLVEAMLRSSCQASKISHKLKPVGLQFE